MVTSARIVQIRWPPVLLSGAGQRALGENDAAIRKGDTEFIGGIEV
jgi:hypothetical protein